jgi:S-adenosylmethionine:tRNA ribosyltransferase-isomerase
MDIQDFDYQLPVELIAQYPLANRTGSRLLCVGHGVANFQDLAFSQLTQLLQPGDLLVVNNTRVLPARMMACKSTGGKVEIMLERLLDAHNALVLLGANKPVKTGQILEVEIHKVEVVDRVGQFFHIRTEAEVGLSGLFEQFGKLPLPPYIRRDVDKQDEQRYQTVYSKLPGAVAAPTAGLHFDQALLNSLKEMGVNFCEVTLHVGAGTFQPVKADKIENHKMHREQVTVSEQACAKMTDTKKRGGRVVAVGTTVVRALESAAQSGVLEPSSVDTNLFITPGYQFNVVDALITNFHLPKSTLLMMVSAFAGYERMMRAYQYAIDSKYRFFSYGDAMFVEKDK